MASLIRWSHVPVWVVILSLAGFVRVYLRAGRPWLFWTVCCLRTLSLLLNFVTGQNLNFREITSLRHIPFLGETVSVPQGMANPWMVVGQLSLWAFMIFVLDASLTVWRRGERRMAVTVGGSIVFFLVAGAGQAALIVWGNAPWLRATQFARDLRVSQQQIAMAAEAANLGFWFRKSERNEFSATDKWRALFGFAKSDRLQLEDFLQRLHPDDRGLERQRLAKTLNENGRYRAEHRVLLPDGEIRWIASEGRVELDGGGKPIGFQGVSFDITDSKQAALEVEAHRNEVAHLMRVSAVGELSSALGHELMQPLAAILLNARAAKLALARENCDLEEMDHILDDIAADDERAGEVIYRLRKVLKKTEFQPEALEANDLIQEVLKLMHYDLLARTIRVVTEFSSDLPPIRGDRVQFQQVLINLILNASDSMSHAAANSRTLTLGSSREGDNGVQISIADSGSGIPSGTEEKIFEPYHTTKPQGLGLGLSLSRSIMAAHGGRLWAENRELGGAIFHITVPGWKGNVQ